MRLLDVKRSARRPFVLALALTVASCGAPEAERFDAGQVVAQPGQQEVVLDSVQVLHVDLDSPVTRADIAGEVREWEQAYMVRLAMTVPSTPSLGFELFVDDQQIGEYGGWEEGIYFWIYDAARLDSIDGGTISYSIARGPRIEVGALLMDADRAFPRVPLDSLRGGALAGR